MPPISNQDDVFLERLRATFKVEADEHLQTIAGGVLDLEKTPSPQSRERIVETVFRAVHSLKGAARAVDLTEIESLCQSLEDVFASWRRQAGTPTPSALDGVHAILDRIGALARLRTPPQPRPPLRPSPPGGPRERSADTSGTASAAPPVRADTPEPTRSAADKAPAEETVRLAVSKLDARLVAAEEMLLAKLATAQRAAQLQALAERVDAWKKAWATVEPQARALRQKLDAVASSGAEDSASPWSAVAEYLDWSRDFLHALGSDVTALAGIGNQDRHVIGKLVDDLLDDSKALLLLPFATITAPFPKLVRDLCREQRKEAQLVVRGEDVQIDKRILEEMKDPLIHLLRNSIDHGIEMPEQRVLQGKPPRGTITLDVRRVNGNKVEIRVLDDGKGIDANEVREAAQKQGAISGEDAAALGDTEALALIFRSEVSTSPVVTSLSGRGLGLAIVREKAEKLGGAVTVEARPGLGTCFRIAVPTMLATFQGVLVEASGRVLVIPMLNVERVVRVKPGDVRTVEGRDTIALGGRIIALTRLADALELSLPKREDPMRTGTSVIVVAAGDKRAAWVVDAVLGEQEVLVKRLPMPLSRVRNVAGATLLASGQLAPILDVGDLLKSAQKIRGTVMRAPDEARPEDAAPKSILVAEDSITSRMLLKAILESAGYSVRTAVDGMEAFTMLRAERFDLVVSDVEMPRLDGFELTARIRADRKLGELPVVLLTALETRDDRERGIDVGANAYIVKSSFDQSDLLGAIRRLTG